MRHPMTQSPPVFDITYAYEVETFSPPRVRGYGGSGRIHLMAFLSASHSPSQAGRSVLYRCLEFPQVIRSPEQRAPGGRLAFYDFLLFESTRTLISTIGRAYATEIYVYRHMRIVCDLYPAEY